VGTLVSYILEDIALGATTPDQTVTVPAGTAIGLAIREAHPEALLTGKKTIVTSMRNGKRIVEWDGITPP
jgi:hypothetical protein